MLSKDIFASGRKNYPQDLLSPPQIRLLTAKRGGFLGADLFPNDDSQNTVFASQTADVGGDAVSTCKKSKGTHQQQETTPERLTRISTSSDALLNLGSDNSRNVFMFC